MSEDIRHFTVTCPAGVPSTNATVFPITMPPRTVSRIDWRVPNGPLGLMGFLLAVKGGPILPIAGSFTFVIANGEGGFWELDNYPDSGDWQCQMYNTGANPHSVYLTFHTDLPVRPGPALPALTVRDLSYVPDLSMAGPPLP